MAPNQNSQRLSDKKDKALGLCIADWACTRFALAIMSIMVAMSRIVKFARHCSASKAGKKIVFVYANDLLGDTMVKLPFFFSLRKAFPQDRYYIVVVLTPIMASLIGKLSLFDEVIEETTLHWRHPLFWLVGSNGIAKSLRWAFFHTAETMIVCHRSRSLGCDFALRLCTPSTSVTYAADVETPMLPMTAMLQAKSYDARYSHLLKAEQGRHQMDEMESLLQFATGRSVEFCCVGEKDVAHMLDFSLAKLMEPKYIVIVPGARVNYRRWPVERFAEVASRLGKEVVVVGSDNETCLADKIAHMTSCRVINLCGKTTLAQLGAILLRASLVVSNETGTANYAAVIGARTICIVGGGDFGAFFPNKHCPNAVSVFNQEPCFNCGWRCWKSDLSKADVAPCVMSVSVDDVMAAIDKIYSTNSDTSSRHALNATSAR